MREAVGQAGTRIGCAGKPGIQHKKTRFAGRPGGRRPPECLYGSLKMREHLRRQGISVARCTVERLMRAHGLLRHLF